MRITNEVTNIFLTRHYDINDIEKVNTIKMSRAAVHINAKNRSMAPLLIWLNISIAVNAVFQEILALARIRHTVSSKRVIVQIQMQ